MAVKMWLAGVCHWSSGSLVLMLWKAGAGVCQVLASCVTLAFLPASVSSLEKAGDSSA